MRPLLGGFFAWRDAGLPLEDFPFDVPPLTRIIVAHRPETIASADRVIVLHGGRVAQDIVRTNRIA